MKNPYISQALTLKNEVGKLLPNGLETTADMPLEFMSKSDDEHLRASFCRINDQSYYIDNYNKKTLWVSTDAIYIIWKGNILRLDLIIANYHNSNLTINIVRI